MKTYVDLWYLAKFLLEWEIFQTWVVEEIRTHFVLQTSPPPPPKIVQFMS
jgi:hypothetical protein